MKNIGIQLKNRVSGHTMQKYTAIVGFIRAAMPPRHEVPSRSHSPTTARERAQRCLTKNGAPPSLFQTAALS